MPGPRPATDYKKHDTIKFLIPITPAGSICFLSNCWEGRVSDKNLAQACGFLKFVEQGDVVLADRGLDFMVPNWKFQPSPMVNHN